MMVYEKCEALLKVSKIYDRIWTCLGEVHMWKWRFG